VPRESWPVVRENRSFLRIVRVLRLKVFTGHSSRVTGHGPSSFSAAEAAGGVLANFSFLVKKLGVQLGQFFAAAMFELSGEDVVGEFVFHGWRTSTITVAESWINCL